MGRRYLRSDSDLPEHDLILWLPGAGVGSVACHVRHYVHEHRHVVIAGCLDGGGVDPVWNAVEVARQVAETVVPEEGEFLFVTYAPQPPFGMEPDFREVTFEVNGGATRPSSAALAGPTIPLPCYRPLELRQVEALAGRPILTFPYRCYTTALAEASNGQSAKRLFDLLVDAGLACPKHGPSPYGEYCGRADPTCQAGHRRQARVWRQPYQPARRGTGGTYIGDRRETRTRIGFVLEGRQWPLPVFRLAAPGAEWGYGGAGAQEGATTLLADYLGFLPRPELRAGFQEEIVARLPRLEFALPISDFESWFGEAHQAWERGLVVVAGPARSDWPTGRADLMAWSVAQGLMDAGFDVYEPGRNAETDRRKESDHRLGGLLHASLLSALDACSMIVVPYDGEAVLQAAEAASALRYAIDRPSVPVVIAYNRVDGQELESYDQLGFGLARVGMTAPRPDVSVVVEAVDRECAAYECLRPGAEGFPR